MALVMAFALAGCQAPESSLTVDAEAAPPRSFAPAPDHLSALREQLREEHPEIPDAAMVKAFSYYSSNYSRLGNPDVVTIVDFDQPSTVRRMHVIDMRSGDVQSYLVAHGRNTGVNYATAFSNVEGSLMSSLGIYLTSSEYEGDNGRSMKLRGMESTNSNAESRAIVMHGADYVSDEFIAANGRLGRSWGCPAVEQRFRDSLISLLKDGSVFLVFHS
jgi:hypothetical protein